MAAELAARGCRVARARDYSYKLWLVEGSQEVRTNTGKVVAHRLAALIPDPGHWPGSPSVTCS